MKLKQDKERLEEIQEFYRTMEAAAEPYREYFAALATLPPEPPPPVTFIEIGNTSVPRGESTNARLQPTPKRN